jgi:hypothetical protein
MKMIHSKFLIPALLFLIAIAILPSCKKNRIISLKSLLIEMTDRNSLTLFPSPYYTLRQFSSYDRKSDSAGGKNWYANDDYTQFITTDSTKGRKEYVLFDSDGPGAIVRWWMTFAGEGGDKGIIRVYFDKNETPVIEDSVMKVLSGHLLAGEPLSSSVSPETEPGRRGHNLYLPLPYSDHCRITYECDAVKITASSRKPSVYYNICYRTYEEGTKVISYSKDELQNAAVLIKDTNEKLLSPDKSQNEKLIDNQHITRKIPANDSINIDIKQNGAAISSISLKLSAFDTEYAMRSVVLRIIFDGNQTVWVPAGDFFGTAYKATTSSTWNSRVDDQMLMESYWVMPFRKSCSVSLVNNADQEVDIDLTVKVSNYRWNERSMYFGSSWHEYHQIMTAGSDLTGGTGLHRDINFADIKGKGIYAGDAVSVYNTVEAWWGEGDEKIYVDGEKFPSSIGTGTEDYYGYAWCRPELFSHPFVAQPSGSGNFHQGLTINMRYRALDAIPFTSSISSDIELWHWLPAIINYGLITYWYVQTPFEINIKPDRENVRRPVPIDPEKPL